jgi:transcriptional regulatory protein AMDR
VQPLTASDFEGCGKIAQIDYVIKYTELCVLISKVLRELFGLNVPITQRRQALNRADEALANWCLKLPASLQLGSSDIDVWSASLHLTYNNFLILLHRPHPKAPREQQDHGLNDADICSSAAATIMSIFEDLRKNDQIKMLWLSDVNALFTAMVQVSVELRFRNPVLAINALRRFDSGLLSLKHLADYWINAESILRLFEESSHIQHGLRLKDPAKEVENGEERQDGGPMQGVEELENSQQPQSLGFGQSDLDILAAAATSGETTTMLPGSTNPDMTSSWRHLFPFYDESQDDEARKLNMRSLENEWRDIYWQEPGICDSFGDRFWGVS